jgi:hypothetical protein
MIVTPRGHVSLHLPQGRPTDAELSELYGGNTHRRRLPHLGS